MNERKQRGARRSVIGVSQLRRFSSPAAPGCMRELGECIEGNGWNCTRGYSRQAISVWVSAINWSAIGWIYNGEGSALRRGR